MRMRKRSEESGSEIDMTPMIDMTFQLIAFFMFVCNFNRDLLDQRVVLPVADHVAPTTDSPQSPIYLNLNENGSVYLPGGLVANPKTDPGPIRTQLAREAQMAKISMKAAGVDQSAQYKDGSVWTTVVIRAHRHSPYGAVQDVIRLAQDAGFTKFWLRANKNQ